MTDERKAQVLAEIIAYSASPAPVGPDEITIEEYARAAGLQRATAQDHLERLVKSGKLARREAMGNGRRCIAYRIASVRAPTFPEPSWAERDD